MGRPSCSRSNCARTRDNGRPCWPFQKDRANGTLPTACQKPALFYAVDGGISNLNFGFITFDGLSQLYVNSGSAEIRASRDIVNLGPGTAIGCPVGGPGECRNTGRDIIYGNMTVAGP